MPTITTRAFDCIGRDLTAFTRRHQTLLATPLDNLPLVDAHAVLADLVRASGPQPFAFRVADDPRLLGIWHSSGTAAVVATYWRHKLAHVDLVLADAESVLTTESLEGLPITANEVESLRMACRPLLVFCRIRRRVPAIASILGMIAYLPVLLDVYPD